MRQGYLEYREWLRQAGELAEHLATGYSVGLDGTSEIDLGELQRDLADYSQDCRRGFQNVGMSPAWGFQTGALFMECWCRAHAESDGALVEVSGVVATFGLLVARIAQRQWEWEQEAETE